MIFLAGGSIRGRKRRNTEAATVYATSQPKKQNGKGRKNKKTAEAEKKEKIRMFGIEVEFNNITRKDAAEVIRATLNGRKLLRTL